MEKGKRMKRKKKYNKKRIIIIAIIAVIILLIIFFLKSKNNTNNKTIIGAWTTDGVTIYEFSDSGKGKLIVPLSEYPFTYKIEDNKLFIDFENETSKDSTYEYSFEDNKMIWKNVEETYLTFTFTRK